MVQTTSGEKMTPERAAREAEADLRALERRAKCDAARHLVSFWPFDATPRRGLDGVLRHGYGRAVEHNPQPEAVARMALNKDLDNVAKALARRIFVLKTAQPDCDRKVGFLYAVADILGVNAVRDWDDLWKAANAGDWQRVCLLLVALQWDAVDRNAIDRRMAAGNLIFGLRDA